jgi:hypothetical protein
MTGQVDGETTQAIEEYQEKNDLDPTGKLTPDTTGGIISDLLFKITGKRYSFGRSSKNFNPMVIEDSGVKVRQFPSDIESKFKNAVGDNYDSFISDVEGIGLDPKIAMRQLYTESAFNPDVMTCKRTSSAGAKGIAQFMPGTWPTYGGGGNPCDIGDALKAYPKMMKSLLSKFPGRLDLSIAGYNSGTNLKAYSEALKNNDDVKEIIDKFVALVDIEKSYTIVELTKILKTSVKSVDLKDANGDTIEKVKKPASAYNLFIKDFMLKVENKEIPPKDRMKAATALWKQQKETLLVVS